MSVPVVVTIGVFDGVHRGHLSVVKRARAQAMSAGARLVVFTFDPHPAIVLNPEASSPVLTLLGEKVRRLRDVGAEEVRVLRFSQSLAEKTPHRFLVDHVFPFYRLAGLVVGYDFAMGKSRKGTFSVLLDLGDRLGFSAFVVPAETDGDQTISSSWIRSLLATGEVAAAATALGRCYTLEGAVESGDGRGRTLGFPTANLSVPPGKLCPARGVYAVHASGGGLDRAPAVVNIGIRPTFSAEGETVEAHILDRDVDLAGKRLQLEFVDRLRGEVKFINSRELSNQIKVDCEATRAILKSFETPPDRS